MKVDTPDEGRSILIRKLGEIFYFIEKRRSTDMARKKIIAGNWKMNKTPSEAVALVEELKPLVANDEVDVVFCVPAIDIVPVVEAAKGSNVNLVICN